MMLSEPQIKHMVLTQEEREALEQARDFIMDSCALNYSNGEGRTNSGKVVDAINGLLSRHAAPTPAVDDARDDVQRKVVEWGARCFGEDHMRDPIVRAARFIEEAAEWVQAVGLPKDHAQRALDYVYSRPPGDPAQECGGVSNTQYALASALGLSVAECEAKEISRCLTKSPEHFAARNRDKIEKIDATPTPSTASEGE